MKKIIFSGKGGAGKTTITSLTLNHFIKRYPNKKILLIDADPASNLLISLGIEKKNITPVGELHEFLPQDENYKDPQYFNLYKKNCQIQFHIQSHAIHYSYLGHHTNNSCLCAYNNSLSYLLKHFGAQNTYDYIFIDREAGIEHLNRSVYGGPQDRLIIVSWPTQEYLTVAQDINELSNMLGTTQNRLLVINNNQGLSYQTSQLDELLQELNLQALPRVSIPQLPIFSGLKKIPSHQILEQMHDTTSLDTICTFIK